MVLVETEGSLLMDGSEQDLFNDAADNLKFHAFRIFLDAFQSGDEFIIRTYVWDTQSANYKLNVTKTITQVPTEKAAYVPPEPTKRFRVSIKQSAGTFRTITWARYEA